MVFSLTSLKTIGVAAGVSIGLYMSGFLVILTPLPLVYASVSKGRRAGLSSAGLALLGVCLLTLIAIPKGSDAGLPMATAIPFPGSGFVGHFSMGIIRSFTAGYYLFFAIIAIVLGEGIHRRWELTRWIGTALLAGLGFFLLALAIVHFSGFVDVAASVRAHLKFIVEEMVRLGRQTGSTGSQVELLAEHGAEVVAFAFRILPAVIFIFALTAVVANALLGRRLIRVHHALSHIRNVARFRLPDEVVWCLVLAGVAFFLDLYIVRTGWLKPIALNVLIALGALYFLQGLAVVVYFLRSVKAPLVRWMAYAFMVLFFQTLGIVIVGVGIADVWGSFRERAIRARRMPQPPEEF